jgi:beta-barrel assembly-enhancing protease
MHQSFSILSLILLITVSGNTFAQKDFNNYRTLQSQGEIPSDFTRSTKSKLDEDVLNKDSDLTLAQKKEFYKGTNYAIDDMLHSGIVVFGDEISNYTSEIVDRLLRNDPDLRKELRVYTMKSNATNAFSTDQGIIFVTTGLMAQITSEAQLAYVLAHEISHYKEKHVSETFDWKTKNYRYSDRIDRLSNHSKEKEFEADRGGIELYHAAGYKMESIFETFDVLMYSYLPFDEIEFPFNYFNSDNIFLPEHLFPKKKYEIKAEEDYDDSNSSHPNIKKRKDSVELIIGQYNNWGETEDYLGLSRFEQVRNIARFENVRSDILEANYGDALYSIFLLEREFPNSMFLKRMKAQVWLNLMIYKKENKANQTLDNISDLEGESAPVHFMLKKLPRDGMNTMALRQVYDLHKAHPEDIELKAIYSKLVTELATIETFKIENFSKKTFNEAAEEFVKLKSDTISQAVDTTEKKSSSKYDRIKRQKNADNSSNFDSTKFYVYGLRDIIADSTFIQSLRTHKKQVEEDLKLEKEYNALSRAERIKIDKQEEKDRMKLGVNEIIVVEPKVFSYRGNNGFDPMKSEMIEATYSEVIESTAKELGVSAYPIDRRTLSEKGTIGFNERNLLISFLSQIAVEDNINIFPVDYQLLKEIEENYGTKKVMFTLVEHAKSIDINWWMVLGSMVIYPTFPFVLTMHIPMAIFNSNETELTVLILDLEKGMIETGNSYNFNEPIYKHNLGAHVYDIFSKLNKTPQ